MSSVSLLIAFHSLRLVLNSTQLVSSLIDFKLGCVLLEMVILLLVWCQTVNYSKWSENPLIFAIETNGIFLNDTKKLRTHTRKLFNGSHHCKMFRFVKRTHFLEFDIHTIHIKLVACVIPLTQNWFPFMDSTVCTTRRTTNENTMRKKSSQLIHLLTIMFSYWTLTSWLLTVWLFASMLMAHGKCETYSLRRTHKSRKVVTP